MVARKPRSCVPWPASPVIRTSLRPENFAVISISLYSFFWPFSCLEKLESLTTLIVHQPAEPGGSKAKSMGDKLRGAVIPAVLSMRMMKNAGSFSRRDIFDLVELILTLDSGLMPTSINVN